MTNKYFIIPIFVPHLGCPHDCVFCNQKRITGLTTDVEAKDVKNIIEEHLATFPEGNKTVEVAFFGGSFTGIDREIQRELLEIAYSYKEKGLIDGIRLSTRPDYIDRDILDLLKSYGVDTIELGVQSLAQDVLDDSGRGHDVDSVYRAADLIKAYDMNLGLQMMLGLVGDTRDKSIYTAKKIIELEPYCVRIYPTLVIRDTFLEKLYKEGSYQALSLEEAVDLTTDILMLFDYNNVDVIRVGLQPTENIQLGKDVVAGPFHPSFRQLVEANIVKNIIASKLEEEAIRDIERLSISVSNRQVSNVAGQKSSNKSYLMSKFSIARISIYGEKMSDDIIKLGLEDKEYIVSIDEYRERYLKSIDLI